MNFEFSESQEQLRDSVRRYLAERAPIDRYVRAQLDQRDPVRDEVWRGLAELGLAGLLVPEALGGSGLGMVEMGVVCEELGRALHPGAFAQSALAAVSLCQGLGGTDDLLRAIARGDRSVAVVFDEPWEAAGESRVVARPDGSSWRLRGRREPVVAGDRVDVLLTTAATEQGPALFQVETSVGVRSVSLESIDPTQPLAQVEIDDAPAERLDVHDLPERVAQVRGRVAIGAAADGLGAAGHAFERAAAYAHERQQFGRPIGSFQAVQHLLVDMLQDLELARAVIYYALWAADAADPSEAHRAATMAKAFASRALPDLGASAIQVFGGIGYTWEHDIHLFYKRLLTLQSLFGDEGAQLDELARLVVDRAG